MSLLVIGTILGVVGGLLLALVLYLVFVWPLRRRHARSGARLDDIADGKLVSDEDAERILDNAVSIRSSAEDIETRIARLKELQRIRERPESDENGE